MAHVQRNIAIKAPIEKVFNYITDPMSSEEWSPGLEKITGVIGSGVGRRDKWEYKMAGMKFNGESVVKELNPPDRYVLESVAGIISKWVFVLEKYYDGDTKLNLDIEYTIPVPILGKLAERAILGQNEKVADQIMNNIKTKMER
ncbi:MAG: SRPBCC family protein [Deltaproteobacteria bacterium]|uniref:SRPBCC family protein n=1 Tax=Candidatus Zymogenus saltonus TaxID=2844893 RepID=A0A9D8K9N4_9DELT|nr:SRPBCC family protein [Candidatus Zymogenus saltonus]